MDSQTTTSPIFCRHCGYNLHGLPENRCAECGHPFDPTNRKTYSTHAGSTLRRRRARRIAILILATIFLAGAACFSFWWSWHREQTAVRIIHRRGGFIITKTIGPPWLKIILGPKIDFLLVRVDTIRVGTAGGGTDEDLAAISELTELRELDIASVEITDAGLEHLKELKKLQILCFGSPRITDAGLLYLRGLNGLQTLALSSANITGPGLEHLKDFKGLRRLILDTPQVTDEDLKHLQGLDGLQYLDLEGTRVTDSGLKYLKDLKGLQKLDVSLTHVTEAGRQSLQEELPGCKVENRYSQLPTMRH